MTTFEWPLLLTAHCFHHRLQNTTQGKRSADDADDDAVDTDSVAAHVASLHSGLGNSEAFISILCDSSPAHNKAVAEACASPQLTRTSLRHSFSPRLSSKSNSAFSPSVYSSE